MQKISAFANGLNMPVIIGEYGMIDKNNFDYRFNYLSAFNMEATNHGIVTAYWDNGFTGEYGFALFNRVENTATEYGEMLIAAILG